MKRFLFTCFLSMLMPLSAAAQSLGVRDVRVLSPHLTGATNPMTLAYAQSSWGFVRTEYLSDSYGQYDLVPTYLPPYEVTLDPTQPAGAAQCYGYPTRAIDRARELGYDIPSGAIIAIIQHDCPHAGHNVGYLYNAEYQPTNLWLFGEKPTEMNIVLGYTNGVWSPFAYYCNLSGCPRLFTDTIDVVGINSPGAFRRFGLGWLTDAAGDTVYAQWGANSKPLAGQFIIRTLESPRDGQPKMLRIGAWTVELRARNKSELPKVSVSNYGWVHDTVQAAACVQWSLPVGSTFRLRNGTVDTTGIRVDAITLTAATISIVENVTENNVAAVQCGKSRYGLTY